MQQRTQSIRFVAVWPPFCVRADVPGNEGSSERSIVLKVCGWDSGTRPSLILLRMVGDAARTAYSIRRPLEVHGANTLGGNNELRSAREDTLCPSFEILKVSSDGSEGWLGNVESRDMALFDIELTAAKSPGKYAILNRQTGAREVLNFVQPRTRSRRLRHLTE